MPSRCQSCAIYNYDISRFQQAWAAYGAPAEDVAAVHDEQKLPQASQPPSEYAFSFPLTCRGCGVKKSVASARGTVRSKFCEVEPDARGGRTEKKVVRTEDANGSSITAPTRTVPKVENLFLRV